MSKLEKYLKYMKESRSSRKPLQALLEEHSALMNEGWFTNNDTAQARRLATRRNKFDEVKNKDYAKYAPKQHERDTKVLSRFKRRFGVKGSHAFLRDTDYTPSAIKEAVQKYANWTDFPGLKRRTPRKYTPKSTTFKVADERPVSPWDKFADLQFTKKPDKYYPKQKVVGALGEETLNEVKMKFPNGKTMDIKSKYRQEWKTRPKIDVKNMDNTYKEWSAIKAQHGPEIANKWLSQIGAASTAGSWYKQRNQEILGNLTTKKTPMGADLTATLKAHGFTEYDGNEMARHSKHMHAKWNSGHIEVNLGPDKHKVKFVNYGRGRPPKFVSELKKTIKSQNHIVEEIENFIEDVNE